MKILKPTPKNINLAAEYLKKGKAVVYPTDTAYGLAVDATNPQAVRNLYKIKERDKGKPIHIVVSSLAMAKKYAKFSKVEEKLFKKLLPGPLTLVAELKTSNQAIKLLSARTRTVGIRMPNNRIALSLVNKLGKPITTSSANPSKHLSKGTTPYTIEHSYKQFMKQKYKPDLFIDAGKLKKIKPSTVVKLKNGKIEILRKGPVKFSVIARSLRRSNPK